MRRWLLAVQVDVRLQARQGFYAATAVIVVLVGGLLVSIPPELRANSGFWVPFWVVVNLPITTFFFMCGLMLLERDEGTLMALAVTPISPHAYLAVRVITLVALAIIETVLVAAIAFEIERPLILVLAACVLGTMLTSLGAVVSARYQSMNELILPGSVLVTFLLLPLLPHAGLVSSAPFLLHPVQPTLSLLRAAYAPAGVTEMAYGLLAGAGWCAISWRWGSRSIRRVMRQTAATGGR
jgi:fluoroquinolone transport system permease protein